MELRWRILEQCYSRNSAEEAGFYCSHSINSFRCVKGTNAELTSSTAMIIALLSFACVHQIPASACVVAQGHLRRTGQNGETLHAEYRSATDS